MHMCPCVCDALTTVFPYISRIVFDSDDFTLATPLFQEAYGFGRTSVTSFLPLLLTVEQCKIAAFMLPFYTGRSDPALHSLVRSAFAGDWAISFPA